MVLSRPREPVCRECSAAHSFLRRRRTRFQYRVEAVLFRVLKPLHYAAISANKIQVANQPSIEVIPMVMEPRSSFYSDPVVVLDFQSLYPSMILAYNLCYSTCLGRLRTPGTTPRANSKIGFAPYGEKEIGVALRACCRAPHNYEEDHDLG